MEEEGLAEETKGTDLKPDKGFRHNPAEVKWKPDLSKYNPQLKKRLKTDMASIFRPAKTLEDAERWIKDNDLAENVLYSGGRAWGGRATKKEALEKFNAVNEEITSFQKRFRIKLPKVKNFYITKSKRGLAHCSVPARQASIAFSKEWGDKEWRNVKAWEARNKNPWDWSIIESHRAYTVRHEYAHILDGEFGITNSPEFRRVKRETTKTYPIRQVSEYAATNNREYFAEAFAQYTSPHYKEVKQFPEPLEKFLDDIIDRLRQ